MKKTILNLLTIALTAAALNFSRAQEITIIHPGNFFGQKPIPVALDGFTGEAAEVLKFDLYVQGFSFVAPEAAQYRISGSSGGQASNVDPRPAVTAIIMNAKPQAMPSICGTVARNPYEAAEAASIVLFGPGVMYIATAKPMRDLSVTDII